MCKTLLVVLIQSLTPQLTLEYSSSTSKVCIDERTRRLIFVLLDRVRCLGKTAFR